MNKTDLLRSCAGAVVLAAATLATPVALAQTQPATAEPAPAPLSPGMKALLASVASLTQKSYGQLDAVQAESERRFADINQWFNLPVLATAAGNARAMNNIDSIRASIVQRQALQNQLMSSLEKLYATAPNLTPTERSEVQRGHQHGVTALKAKQAEMDGANLAYNTSMRDLARFVDGERAASRLTFASNGAVSFGAAGQKQFETLVAKLQRDENRVTELDASIRQEGADARETVKSQTVDQR